MENQELEGIIDTIKPGKYSNYLRQFVTILFTVAFCYGFLTKIIDAAAFTGVFGTVIAFYFAGE
jgi:hypothetical protein